MWADRQTYRDYHRNRSRARVERWHPLGLCINCGLPSRPYWRCFTCRVKCAARDRRAYWKRKQTVKESS